MNGSTAQQRFPALQDWLRRVCSLIVVGCCVTFTGCVLPREPGPLRYLPTEPITAKSCGRVSRLGAWKVSSLEPLEGIIHEISSKVQQVAMDADRGILYVQYRERPLGAKQPAGVYGYDLSTGKCVVRSLLPAHSDMTGQALHRLPLSNTVFDFQRQAAYLTDKYDDDCVLIRISLTGELPTVLMRGVFRLTPRPVLGNGWLLMEAREERANGAKRLQVMVLDPASREHLGPHDVKGDWIELPRIVGGYHDHVITHDFVRKQLIVYRIAADALVEVARKRNVTGCSSVSPACMPTEARPWLVVLPDGLSVEQQVHESAGTVCVLPDLKQSIQLEGLGTYGSGYVSPFEQSVGPSTVLIPNSTVLVLRRGDDRIFFDGLTGKRIGAIRFGRPPVEWYDAGSGFHFTDQRGLYLGVFGTHWIELFGVGQKAGS